MSKTGRRWIPTSPHSIQTSLEVGLINNVTGYMLPLHANIVGNSFEPNPVKDCH